MLQQHETSLETDHCRAQQSKQAYSSGNGAEAHDLSAAGKKHQAAAESYNAQASAYIFRENNSVGRVPSDTIDLHGQFVEEAEDILEARIKQARAENQTHLHVIVGKGNHSPDHIQKIKPRVEQVCQQLGLKYKTEANEGRMYIDLTGGNVDYDVPQPGQRPPHFNAPYQGGGGGGYPAQLQQGYEYGQQQQQGYGYGQQQQPQYGGQPQQQFDMDQQNQRKEDPIVSCIKGCCIVM